MKSVRVLGVRVDDVAYAEAMQVLRDALASRTPHAVTTPNPEIVMLARRDPAFMSVLNRSALNIPDGIGLLLAARLAGDGLREHVQGTDLVLRLAAESATEGWRWFLLGGVGGVFNYLSGDIPRAPGWLRRLHLEWLHRLITQPWRWRRQLALPQFAMLALLAAARRRRP